MEEKNRSILAILGAVTCWSIAPVLIRYVMDFYSVVFQTFVRYFLSLIILWVASASTLGRASFRANFRTAIRLWPKLLVMALVNFAFQATYTYGFYLVLPTVGTLVYQSGVIFSVTLALIFFPDERAMMRHMSFFFGIAMAITGVCMTVLGGHELGNLRFATGVFVLAASAASFSLLGTLIRKWLGGLAPVFATSTIFTFVTPMFLFVYLITTGPVIPHAPTVIWVILALSGVIGVGIGHTLYYIAVPHVGVATASSFSLLIPFLAGVFSFLVFGETLKWVQFLGGAVLLSGSYIVTRTRFKTVARTASEVATKGNRRA